MAFLPLDGPSLQGQQDVTDSVVFRVRVGSSELDQRKVVTIQPLDGLIWVYFGDNSTVPSAATVKASGFTQPRGSIRSYEASTSQEIYVVSDTGTVDIRFAERA